MLHRAYRFSSSWESVVRECKYLEGMSFKLGYPDRPLPRFKSQSLWRNMKFRRTTPCRRETSFGSYYLSKIRDLRTSSENSSKISNTIQTVFTSPKIGEQLQMQERKPPAVSQQCVVYQFKCDLGVYRLHYSSSPSALVHL